MTLGNRHTFIMLMILFIVNGGCKIFFLSMEGLVKNNCKALTKPKQLINIM